ncbi:MAG TPA: DUF4439 domain-containing protein [Jatrophihabitans sp.]|nr:DUF4439 domain-containing protein [Jatrophihabitans sp.]
MTRLDAAWQQALGAEHQAVFGYSLLGPWLTGSDQQLAVACSDAHEALRDATADQLARAGLTPAAPAADYPALYPVADGAAARRLAIRLEDACAAAWRYVYLQAASRPTADASGGTATSPAAARVAGDVRETAQSALTASAVRGARWRVLVTPTHPTTAFPGV